jgi:signal transduction histidine kinase
MSIKIKANWLSGVENLMILSGSLVVLIGAVTLLGWIIGSDLLVNIRSQFIPMSPANSLFFIVYGIILLESGNLKRKNYKKYIITIISLFSLYGFLQFTGYLVNQDLTLDNIIFPVTKTLGKFPIKHMSPYSGLLFFICGIAILLKVLSRRTSILNIIGGLGIIVAFAGFVATLGYMYGTPFLYSGNVIPLSLRTAVSFLFLGFGLLFMAGKDTIFLSQFIGYTSYARLLRIFVPLITSLFVLEGIMDVILTHYYKINEALVPALITIFSVVISIPVILNISRRIFQSADKAEIERLRALEQLKLANDAKDKLFKIISHDLRSPFTSILGFFELLNDQYDHFTEEEKRSFLQEIRKSSENAFELLDNLLKWSRTQTGGIKMTPALVDLAELSEQQVEILKNNALLKNINLSSQIPAGTKAFADRDMIKTILLNLIGNAIKFTYKGGKVTLSATIQNGEVLITVEDNGVGVAHSDLENIFKLDKSNPTFGTSNEKGTGLGLQICKEFVEINGGRLFAESEPGKGSKFIFTLPAHTFDKDQET